MVEVFFPTFWVAGLRSEATMAGDGVKTVVAVASAKVQMEIPWKYYE